MASKSVKRINLFPLAILVVGIVLAILLVFRQQIFLQNASVATLSNLAVKGTIFVDTNKNGKQDNGETGYTGAVKPIVRLALFNTQCVSPTPVVSITSNPPITGVPSTTITPVPSGCYYPPCTLACPINNPNCCNRPLICPKPTPSVTPVPTICPEGTQRMCPEVACVALPDGTFSCPKCGCYPMGGGVKPLGGSAPVSLGTGVSTGQQGVTSPGSQMTAESGSVGKVDKINDNSDIQQADFCKRDAIKIVDCTVNADGTYSCIVTNTTFTRALLVVNPPQGYVITTHNNPYNIDASLGIASALSVDFGIVQNGTPIPPIGCQYVACTRACPIDNPNCCTPTLICPKVTPSVTPVVTCIPRPLCLNKDNGSTCPEYIRNQPLSTWCPPQATPYTSAQTTTMLQFLNEEMRKAWGK